MAITLVGEVVNQCDVITGFNAGSVDTDIYTEPTGSIGAKTSSALGSFYTTTLGASAPYNFASGGGEFGYHIIMWMNGLTPLNATTGMQIVVGNGTSRGRWNVGPPAGYTGGFISRVINTARAFDVIAAGSWTTGGNPAQLSNVTQVGGAMTTITSIMGNFNNILIDQITTGLGVRADAGTIGTPNTFETVRAQDEDTSKWGWWTSAVGNIVAKGKLYIGPVSGTATSVFTDSSKVVAFSASRVATGFYEFSIRGANTDVTWNGMVVRAEDTAIARWSLSMESGTKTFVDSNSLWQGFDTVTLQANATLTNVKLDNGISVVQNSAVLSGCEIVNAASGDGVALIVSNNPANISNCRFTFSDGHAIRITTPGTYTFTGNIFTGYSGTAGSNPTPSTGSNDAAIYNNSSGLVTVNITGGGSNFSVRNGASATTVVNISVPLEVNSVTQNSRVLIIGNGGAEGGNLLLEGYADSTGKVTGSFSGATPQSVFVRVRNAGIAASVIQDDGGVFTDQTLNARDATGSNDVQLLPAVPAASDAIYFSGNNPFGVLEVKVTTAGTTYVLTWEYWNGAWTALSVTDTSNSFKTTGWHRINFTKPSDWATTTINSQGPYYYMRARVTSGGGTGASAEEVSLHKTVKYYAYDATATISTGTGLTTGAIWIVDPNNSK